MTHWPESEEAFPLACNRKMAQFRDFQADSGKISPLLSSSSIVTMPPWGSVPLGGGSPMAVTPGNLYHLQVPQRALVLLNILLYFFSSLPLLLLPLNFLIVSPQSVLSKPSPCRMLLVAAHTFLTSRSVLDHRAAIWRDQMIPGALKL